MRLAILLLLPLAAGCSVAQGVVELPGGAVRAITPGQEEKKPADPVALQEAVLRFSGGFQAALEVEIERLAGAKPDLDPYFALQTRIMLTGATTSIASGANPVANLLDLTAFVTLGRMSVEEHWLPRIFGEAGRPLLEAFRNAETEVWRLAAAVLTPAQRDEFLLALVRWRAAHSMTGSVLSIQASGLAAELAATSQGAEKSSGGLFSVFSLDPLAGLDPAVREITKTRLLAERGLFVAQQLPKVLRWQVQLLTMQSLEMPAIKQLVANTTSVSASVERASAVVEKLPDRLTKEREEILKALEAQEKALRPLLQDARQALEAGSRMSESLTGTLKSADAVLKRVDDAKAAAPPPDPNAEPFRIADYTKAAAQAEATAKQLTEILQSLERILASEPVGALAKQAAPVVDRAESGGKALLDRALLNAAILVIVILAAALVYRVLASRLAARRPSP